MTEPTPLDLDGLVREAEACCPCRVDDENPYHGCRFGAACDCWAPRYGSVSEGPCEWAGHATIARAVRIAELVGQLKAEEGCGNTSDDCVCYEHAKRLRDELRRAVEGS